jgi:hypothetical protein
VRLPQNGRLGIRKHFRILYRFADPDPVVSGTIFRVTNSKFPIL